MATGKTIYVIRPNEESAKRWAEEIKREKEEQAERDQQRRAQERRAQKVTPR